MEESHEILKKSSFLIALSVGSYVEGSVVRTFYYKNYESALISILHLHTRVWLAENINDFEVYVNRYYVLDDIPVVEGKKIKTIVDRNCTEEDSESSKIKIPILIDKKEINELIQDFIIDPDPYVLNRMNIKEISGNITGFLVCNVSKLVHVEAYKVNIRNFMAFLAEEFIKFYYDENAFYGMKLKKLISSLSEDLLHGFDSEQLILTRILMHNPPIINIESQKTFTAVLSIRRGSENQVPGLSSKKFETLPPAVLRIIGLNMTLEAIGRTCQTSKYFDSVLCKNETFWQEKVRQDFGEEVESNVGNQNWIDYYKTLSEKNMTIILISYKLESGENSVAGTIGDSIELISHQIGNGKIREYFEKKEKKKQDARRKKPVPKQEISKIIKIKIDNEIVDLLESGRRGKPLSDFMKGNSRFPLIILQIEGYPETTSYFVYEFNSQGDKLIPFGYLPIIDFLKGKRIAMLFNILPRNYNRNKYEYRDIIVDDNMDIAEFTNSFPDNSVLKITIDGIIHKVINFVLH